MRNQRQFPIFMDFWRKRRWDMNDLEAATFENGWLAYTVKAVD